MALSPGDMSEAQAFGPFLERLDAAIAGGLRAILLREFELGDACLLRLARVLRQRLDNDSAEPGWLGVHDRVHIAIASKADGVHLGHRSLSPQQVRALVKHTLVIGLSTHAHDRPSEWMHADYLFHGPVRTTPSKQGLLEAIGIAGLRRARLLTEKPLWALGGIRPSDVDAILKTGVNGIAVLSGILGQDNPASATESYLVPTGQ